MLIFVFFMHLGKYVLLLTEGQCLRWSGVYLIYILDPSLTIYFSREKSRRVLLILSNGNLMLFVAIFMVYFAHGETH